MSMRESVAQLADLIDVRPTGQSAPADDRLPAPQSPVPLEGEETEWLVADAEDDHECLGFLLPEPKLLTTQVSFDAAHGGGVSPRAVLSALHRLRI